MKNLPLICFWFTLYVHMWRKALLLKYIGLPIRLFFNIRSTLVRLLVNWSLEVLSSKDENVFSSVNGSLVLGLSAVVGCSSLLSRVRDQFQLAPVSWLSCRQQASLFIHGHGRAAFLFCYKFFYSKFWATDAVFFKV